MKPSAFQSLPQLLEYAAEQRHNAGIIAVPAHLFRDLVIAAAEAGAASLELTGSEETFLREACNAVDGLRKDFSRPLYVHANRLYRLGRFAGTAVPGRAPDLANEIPSAELLDQPEIADEPAPEPAPKSAAKRGRKPRKKPPPD